MRKQVAKKTSSWTYQIKENDMLDTLLKLAPYVMNLISGIILAAATYTINKTETE